jgi:hypothetical protein
MYLDTQLQFALAQSLIAAAGDLPSTNLLDTFAPQDEGIGEFAYLHVRIGTAATSAGAATMAVVLQTDTNINFATAMVEFPLVAATAVAALTANTVIYKGRLPIGLKRYMRIVFRIGTAALTAGTADAQILKDLDAQQYLPRNFTVS